jgi:hypothetical protein
MEMKLAATKALAALAKEDVPDSVIRAYGLSELHFSREYILPKPLDPRVMMWIAPAVAKAAMESGVARRSLDLDAYLERLAARQGQGAQTMYLLETKARKAPKRVVYGEGREPGSCVLPTMQKCMGLPTRSCSAMSRRSTGSWRRSGCTGSRKSSTRSLRPSRPSTPNISTPNANDAG